MKQSFYKIVFLFFFIVLGLESDTLILKNGKVYKNVYTKTNKGSVEMTLDGKTKTFPKSQIKSIKKKKLVVKKMNQIEPSTQSTKKAKYKDNGDGTVTDKTTGLIWQKCSIGQTDNTCEGEAKVFNWEDAIKECESLKLAGKKWKLPSIEQLETLFDRNNSPNIDTNFFPNTVSNYYWSSTTLASFSDGAWGVDFDDGNVGYNSDTNNYHVRCVSGQ
ncbi:MAG: DUF1566 domain-containing protein [Leptospiraceae bacterium]|nr:DUF1566 domain-containing protein [Leptospiraceae bacterium]